MGAIKDSLTFDDVSLVPQYSSVLPSETDTFSKLCDNLNLQIPLMSSAMDTITESKMAIAISKLGGIGVIHRNLSIEKQVMEIKKVKKNNYLVGAAIGVRAAPAARAGRRVPAGGRTGNGSLGGLPRATNSRLRTGTDKGNPTV